MYQRKLLKPVPSSLTKRVTRDSSKAGELLISYQLSQSFGLGGLAVFWSHQMKACKAWTEFEWKNGIQMGH